MQAQKLSTILSLAMSMACVLACDGGRSEQVMAREPVVSAAPQPPASPPAQQGRLIVFAATSLKDAFAALADEFESHHHGVEVAFNFAGTQELRTQLEQGAPADVFASADQKHMGELLKAARVISPVTFARNEPVIIVAKESAALIQGIADLKQAKRLVFGLPDVPIGRYTLQILDNASATLGADFGARVETNVVSREPNVRQVLAKVSLGEAQAGIVYRTDTLSAKDQVSVLTIPPEMNVFAEYPIATLASAQHPALAQQWIALVVSPDGQRILSAAGFLAANNASP